MGGGGTRIHGRRRPLGKSTAPASSTEVLQSSAVRSLTTRSPSFVLSIHFVGLARAYHFPLFSPSGEALFVRLVGVDAGGMLEEFVERIQ